MGKGVRKEERGTDLLPRAGIKLGCPGSSYRGALGRVLGQSRRPIIRLDVVLVAVSIFQLFFVRKSLAREALVVQVASCRIPRVVFVSWASWVLEEYSYIGRSEMYDLCGDEVGSYVLRSL